MVFALATMMAGCASLPPPTGELSAAQQAVSRAENADADQYASAELASARNALGAAQSAMSNGDEDDARTNAETAAAQADLAVARSQAATTSADYDQHRNEIAGLRQRLNMGADDAPAAPLQWPAPAGMAGQDPAAALSGRLVALDADARLQGMAAYERLRARQAVDALANVRKSARPHAVQVADARVTAAELAAHTAATQREVDRLDRVRSDLLVEASRQDAERSRQEAERLRMEAQVQAEEAERLRASIEAESTARQAAEDVILDVTGTQTSKLAAAREKEAALARQEAELTAGASLPPSKRDVRGEVFTLAGDAFASGGATLTGSAKTTLKALAAYLKAGPVPRVKIEAHTDGQGDADKNQQLSQRRADAVRDALAGSGIPKSKMQSSGLGESSPIGDDNTAAGRARNRRIEIIVSSK